MIKPGKYRHYKGGTYVVLFTADHDEDEKPMVVYVNDIHGTYYVATLSEFTAKVTNVNGDVVPRYQLIDPL